MWYLGHSPSLHWVHTNPENSTFTKQETQGSLSSPEIVPGTSKFCCSVSQDLVRGTGAAADKHTCRSCLAGIRQKGWAGHLEGGLQCPGPGKSVEDTSFSLW